MKKAQLSFELCNLSYQIQQVGLNKESILYRLKSLLQTKAQQLGAYIKTRIIKGKELMGALSLHSWVVMFENHQIEFQMIHCKSSNSWYIRDFDIK